VRSDRLLTTALLLALALAGCPAEGGSEGQGNKGRFDAAKPGAKKAATAKGFCDASFPASGEGALRFPEPATREVPGAKVAAKATAGWRWVNVWATWCVPCREEMALLGRWRDAAAKDGSPFELELLSIDAEAALPVLTRAIEQGLPGRVTWIRSEAESELFFEQIGAGKAAAIPIQAIVDPAGNLRCVRVGAVHDRDYGVVRALLAGG
jgi:thiol-disulfide isomerase/thioredoxin